MQKRCCCVRVFTLMLVYRKPSGGMQEYLLARNSRDIIAGNFNCDLLKVLENKLDIFADHVRMINRSLIDDVCVKKTLMEEFFIKATVDNCNNCN